ncbi:acyl-CoA dehydrogenase family protein [Amycolatopsis sp. GM8]|uniref:acyl-CoA dehydrogenase family protein n=1 Tax=Amycolatopsis sp. GM8 TaxID=2896530 RepID=UPI001F217E97|nr:acyl-CoA dehydrogenase family protein [Amycolatopsis sp. GM8]
MELELSAEQRLFRTTTKSFLEKEFPLERVRGLAERDTGFDREWWARGAELGWTAMLVPEELGGGSISGAGLRDLAIVAEELGRGVAPGPLLATNTVLAGLVAAQQAGPDHAAAIEDLVAGQRIASWAVYEPGGQWDPRHPALIAKATPGGYRLHGVKDRVEAAGQADLFLVTAATGDGVAQFLVPAATAGVVVEPQWSLDLARRFHVVRFDDVEVPASALVGSAGADEVLERQALVALVLQCAETCGGVERVFEFTTQWLFDRFSFGRPLASYQALKHRFADMRTWLEACQATTQAAITAVQDGAADAPELVSVAKSYVGDRAVQIIQDCVQMHGGIGVTWEHDLHLFLRRATVNRSLYGTPEDHRRRLADLAGL